VTGRERTVDRGTRVGLSALRTIGQEVRDARLARGLSQRAVASAAAVQQARLSRIERGLVDGARVVELSRILATVGLEL
jgi:transcriptional regulator with XRE-family HTH domain